MKLLYFLILGISSFQLFAIDIFIVCSPDINITKTEIKESYIGNKQLAGSIKLNLVENKSLQNEFLTKVIGIDKSKYDALWAKKSFQDGINAPKVKGSDSDVIDFVKNNSGAIGYVSSPAGLKVIAKF